MKNKWASLGRVFHGIIESCEMEEILKGHLVQLSYHEQEHLQLDQLTRAPSSLTSIVSKDEATKRNDPK